MKTRVVKSSAPHPAAAHRVTDKAPASPKGRPKSTPNSVAPAVRETDDVIIAPSLSAVVGYLLRRSHNAFQSYWMAKFYTADHPITPVQGGMLVVIGSHPELTQTELARIMNVEGPTLMQSIDRLQENGYLQRTPRVGDRRSNCLQLTPLGHEVLDAIQGFLPVRDADLLSILTPSEINQLTKILTKVVRRAHARLKEIQDEDRPAPVPRRRAGHARAKDIQEEARPAPAVSRRRALAD